MIASGVVPRPHDAQSGSGPQLTGYLRTNWSQDPYSYGSYSFIAVAATRDDYGRLAEPVMNRLFFAGEATNRQRNSSVHAALETGRSVAQYVLAGDHQNIGIVGAGMSGLVAAHGISADGRNVHVIEARDRMGGRIHTDHSLGVAADLGASWLHGAIGNPLTELTDMSGMRKVLANTRSSNWVARAHGGVLKEADVPAWVVELGEYDNRAGTEPGTLNESAYTRSADYRGDEFIFPDGYAEIFKQFSGHYEVTLSEPVTAIEYGDAGVQVTTNGAVHEFDAVVVTVPLGVLKSGDISFSPELPQEKRNAIERLGFGVLDKIYLKFDEVFWDREQHLIVTPFTGYPRGHYNDWLNLYPLLEQPILVAFNGGPAARALSTESDETVVGGALNAIRSAYGHGPD